MAYHPEEDHDLIGKLYQKDGGRVLRLLGILYGDDDWYYLLVPAGSEAHSSDDQHLISCVANLEDAGFEMVA